MIIIVIQKFNDIIPCQSNINLKTESKLTKTKKLNFKYLVANMIIKNKNNITKNKFEGIPIHLKNNTKIHSKPNTKNIMVVTIFGLKANFRTL